MIFLGRTLLWWSLQRDTTLVTGPELPVRTSLAAFSIEKNIGVDFCSQGDYITQQHFSISVLSCEKRFHKLHFPHSCRVISFHSSLVVFWVHAQTHMCRSSGIKLSMPTNLRLIHRIIMWIILMCLFELMNADSQLDIRLLTCQSTVVLNQGLGYFWLHCWLRCLLIPDANRIRGDSRCKRVVPEFICREDDPSLQKKRSKHPQKKTQAQWGKQTLEIHMFQTGIWRPT